MDTRSHSVEVGPLRIVVVRRDDRENVGVVIQIQVAADAGHWAPALKFDAFGSQPHWHLYGPSRGGARVMALSRSHPLENAMDLLHNLPCLLSAAGFLDEAKEVERRFDVEIIELVRRMVGRTRSV